MTKAQELLQAMRNVVEADVAEGKYDNWVPAEKPPLGSGKMAQAITKEQQAEILAAAQRATPGPWHAVAILIRDDHDRDLAETRNNLWVWNPNEGKVKPFEDNANFIALARTAIPGYAALVAQQERQLDIAKTYLAAWLHQGIRIHEMNACLAAIEAEAHRDV